MLPDVFADADLVRAEYRLALCHRDAARAVVRLDHRSVRQGSLLRLADHHGPVDVPGFENDADDGNRSAAADHDEDHARYHGGYFYDLSDIKRPGGVYFYQQTGGTLVAGVGPQHS